MLKDMDHPQWKASHSGHCLVDSVAGAQRDALVLTIKTLEQIEGILCQRTQGAFLQEIQNQGDPNHRASNSQRSITVLKNIPIRLLWALSRKADVEKALSVLREQIKDLEGLRKNRFQPEALPLAALKIGKESTGSAPTPDVSEARIFSQRLYDRIQPAVCTCHQVNLRLDTSNKVLIGAKPASFRLVITPDPVTTQTTCTCLLIRAEAKTEGGSEQVPDPVNTPLPERSASQHTLNDAKEPAIRKLMASYGHAASGSGTSRQDASGPSSVSGLDTHGTSTEVVVNTTPIVAKLCSLSPTTLKLLAPPGDPVYIGLLGTASERGYGYCVYMEQDSFPSSYRMSLANILHHSDKHLLIPRYERIRTAFILAAAMLQYGSFSTSWFREHWRSRDISFFFDPQKKLQQELCSMDPHITAPFPVGPASPVRASERNDQLFSLAVVLTEIAFGDLLEDIRDRKNINGSGRIWEEYKLKELVRSKMLMGEVGRKYAKVVEACVGWDFGDGDLDKKEVQGAFYENVVKPLERCLRSFDE